ncbi:hypothetical protein CAPTEDRAFT_216903 [Capitella teleta]|uniref:Uncharacterized protein n=1 Tax=Capitella teleta TaxID=283909 RepID=R7VIE0_CAPTE|nr:hypothetical protein CAPTEDRAFT_216903 [Capitella teleta]|eukprot:ELU18608.1 hypothetical protein CAPTEDRAFT_216903 [Capitella teleta]
MEEIKADIIRPICRLSFEAYKRNEVSLSKVDLEKVGVKADDVLQSGFLTKKVKVSLLDDPVERFSFSHKTFLEYLAAKHLAQTPDDLKDWLQTIDAHEWEDEHGSLKSFFIDLLHGDSFVEASLVIMECFTFSHETNEFPNFPASCLLLELLRHLKGKKIILSPEIEDELKKKCLSIINDTVNLSIHDFDYIFITFATINQNAKPRDISMNLDTEAEHVVDYLRNLKECPGITLTIECADESAANESSVADAMQREYPNDFLRIALEQGLGNDIQGMEYKTYDGRRRWRISKRGTLRSKESFLRAELNKITEKLKMNLCDEEFDSVCLEMLPKLSSNPQRKMLNDIQGMEYAPSKGGLGLHSFMRGALDKPLKTQKMNLRQFDSVCLEMLLKLLSNPQLKILHLSNVDDRYVKHLLPPLSRLDALDELYLHIKGRNGMESRDIQYYEQILKMNKMQKLKIGRYHAEISDELKSVLQRTIPTMTALKMIELRVIGSFDFWSSAEDHLQLESFTLRVTSLKSDSIDNLCELFEKWTNLQSLCIERIQNRVRLLKMFAAIAKCQMLNTLEIHDTGIGDDFIDPFLEMLKSLKQLKSLQLWSTKLSADGKQKIKDLAQQREKQLSVRFGVFD